MLIASCINFKTNIIIIFQPCQSKSENLSNYTPVEYISESSKMSPRMMNQMVKYAKYAKSISVKAPEKGVTSVKLTAVYKGNLCDDEERTITLTQNGQSYTFPKLTEYIGAHGQMNTWTSDRPIHVLKGTITNGKGEHKFEVKPNEYCTEVIPNLSFSLHHEPEHVKMMN